VEVREASEEQEVKESVQTEECDEGNGLPTRNRSKGRSNRTGVMFGRREGILFVDANEVDDFPGSWTGLGMICVCLIGIDHWSGSGGGGTGVGWRSQKYIITGA